MCGIAGILSLNKEPIEPYAIKRMCDVVAHRGPDDAGYALFSLGNRQQKSGNFWFELTDNNFKHKNVHLAPIESDYAGREIEDNRWHLALGHRRLAIIDLTPKAHQPMSDRGKRVWITYSGEVYNFRGLRAELEKAGYAFYSNSDTEVIINSYIEWGIECVAKFNGMFAFALWDNDKNKLYLCRDRYGVKPLYYTVKNNCLVFGSEIKSILQSNCISAALDLTSLAEYFTFQNNFGERTLFKDIFLLEPGHYLEIDCQGPNTQVPIKPSKYWDYTFINEPDKGEEYYKERLLTEFKEAVSNQLVADVEVGSYLSGGMDSSSITVAASKGKERWKAFTCGFDVSVSDQIERFFDERDKAEIVSSAHNLEHYEMVIHAGDLEWALPRVIWHTEDLRLGMCYPHYFMAQLASRFIKVVLSGPGGDEMLAGYPWRYRIHSESAEEFPDKYYQFWCRLIPDDRKKQFFTTKVSAAISGYSSKETFNQFYYSNPNLYSENMSSTKRAMYFEAKTFLHGILILEDKLGMAHSLESRVPFLDNGFVDFATRIPTRHLVNFGLLKSNPEQENLASKYIFRKALEGLLPEPIINGQKQGFSAPERTWYRTKLVDYIRATLLAKESRILEYINRQYIEKVIDEHINKGVNHRLLIWSLLSFEWWNRQFMEK